MKNVPILRCNDLAIGYKNQKSTLKEISKDLNLSLNRGELVCLVGPNGAGSLHSSGR
jgi:iron complex transport system ATP-binding protein